VIVFRGGGLVSVTTGSGAELAVLTVEGFQGAPGRRRGGRKSGAGAGPWPEAALDAARALERPPGLAAIPPGAVLAWRRPVGGRDIHLAGGGRSGRGAGAEREGAVPA
jgi:hypothetical protein